MTVKNRRQLRRICWNGISIQVPSSWEASVSASRHLHFEHSFSAVLEVRWEIIPAGRSEEYIQNSLQQIEKLSQTRLTPLSLPSSTDNLFSGFDTHCYTRQKGQSPSVLLLFCRTCSTFILLQFFQNKEKRHPLEEIASLCCHQHSGEEWSIQDFNIHVPLSFQLSSYNIGAGMTVLHFVDKKVLLHICRIAPATLRLQRNTLEEIFTTLAGLDENPSLTGDHDTFLYYQRYPSIARQLLMRLRKTKPFCLAKIWHVVDNDRILAVTMEGIHPLNHQLFDFICDSYETFSLKT